MRKTEYTIEEIRAIQKEEIHNFISKCLWSLLWVALFVAMNFILFECIAAAQIENILGLKICAGALNYITCISFYNGMLGTWGGE